MGCSSSKASEPSQQAGGQAGGQEKATEVAPAEPVGPPCEPARLPSNASNAEIDAAVATIEKGKVIGQEKFQEAIMKLLIISIEGYPRALRSTMARRNEMLRKHNGNQDTCADDVKDQASNLTEEGKTWLIGMVPVLGLPGSVIYPAWRALRRCCLLAGIYGHDLNTDETRAKILSVFAGLRGAVVGEYVLEQVLQAVWVQFAGPASKFMPVGTLASKLVNVEGHVMALVGHETFTDGRRVVPPEEYALELDPEPTSSDYLALAKDSSVYGLWMVRGFGETAVEVAKNRERREATASWAVSSATAAGQATVSTAMVLGKGAVAAVTAPDAKDKAISAAGAAKDAAVGAASAAKDKLKGEPKKP